MGNCTLMEQASEYFLDIIVDYVDIDYSLWLSWLLMPLLVTFLLPAVIILLFYVSAIIFHIYRLYRWQLVGNTTDWWHRSRKAVAAVWDAHGWLWHGYEISGIEKIPVNSPVLFIFYHGALPVDMYYFLSKFFLYKDVLIHSVADRFLFKIPGWAIVLEGLHVIPGTVQQCSNVLKEGNYLAISPGGVYEAQFGNEEYRLLWKQRLGFAKVALDAKVPIVPIFTSNVREAFRTVGILRRLFLTIYSVTRVPLAPVYGGFPVKLITHVGDLIPYDASLTPDQLHVKVAAAVEALIEEHQRIPGSITRALIERIYRVPKTKKIEKKAAENSSEDVKHEDNKNSGASNGDCKQKTKPDEQDEREKVVMAAGETKTSSKMSKVKGFSGAEGVHLRTNLEDGDKVKKECVKSANCVQSNFSDNCVRVKSS